MFASPAADTTRVSKLDARQLISSVDHRLLRQLARDLLQFDFGLERNQWPRWAAVAFLNGLRLAHCEPALAAHLLTPAPAPLMAESERILEQLRTGLPLTDELGALKRGFAELTENPPAFIRDSFAGLGPDALAAKLARWFVAAAVWGLRTGLQGEDIHAGHLTGLVERLPLGQQFVGNRLVILARCSRRKQRPALVEMFTYSYPSRSVERRVLPAAALQTFRRLRKRESLLDCSAWVLSGFRDGLMLSQDADFRGVLFAELTRTDLLSLVSIFERRVGRNPAGWSSSRLVAIATAWLSDNHPHVVTPDCRAAEFERIRHLFDFAFWMGMTAGGTETGGVNAG